MWWVKRRSNAELENKDEEAEIGCVLWRHLYGLGVVVSSRREAAWGYMTGCALETAEGLLAVGGAPSPIRMAAAIPS